MNNILHILETGFGITAIFALLIIGLIIWFIFSWYNAVLNTEDYTKEIKEQNKIIIENQEKIISLLKDKEN